MVYTLADGTQMTRRTRIILTGAVSGALSDYQLKLVAAYAAAMQNNFNDLRFTQADMQTLIDAWLEDKIDGALADVWAELPATPANGDTQDYWMYYGNAGVASDWDIGATFLLGDDFPGSSLDGAKWTEELKGTGASIIVTGGECKLDVPDNQVCSANIQSIADFTNDVAIHVRRKCPNDDEYIGLSLGSGNVCAYDGGSTNWFITTKKSGYFYSIQSSAGGTWQGIIEMPASGSGVRIGSDFAISITDLNNYRIFEYIYDSSGNLKWYIDRGPDIRPLGEGFEKYASNPLTMPNRSTWGAVHPDALYFSAGEDGYKYWLFYETVHSGAEYNHLVRSNDGINFVETGVSNPILSPDSGGNWDDKYIADPSVVKVGSTWYMYYCGVNTTSGEHRIGLATSTDGKSWSRITDGIDSTSKVLVPNTGLTEEAGDKFVSPTVYHDGTNFWMWYISKKAGTEYCMCLAESTDGKSWTKSGSNPVYEPGGEIIWHIDVSKHDGSYYCYFCHSSAGHLRLLKSTNKTTWALASNDPVLEYSETWEGSHIYESGPAVDENGDLVLIDNKMWMYYGSRYINPDNDYFIGLAKSWENIDVGPGAELLNSVVDSTFLSDSKKILITQGAYSSTERGTPTFLDWAFVRKYVPDPPTYAFGSEEHQRRTPQFM